MSLQINDKVSLNEPLELDVNGEVVGIVCYLPTHRHWAEIMLPNGRKVSVFNEDISKITEEEYFHALLES